MPKGRMWSRKTVDEDGPLWEFNIEGEGGGQGVDEKTPPRAQDSLKDPVLERTADRFSVPSGYGGEDPQIADDAPYRPPADLSQTREFSDEELARYADALASTGVKGAWGLNPTFVAQQFGLSPEEAVALIDDLGMLEAEKEGPVEDDY